MSNLCSQTATRRALAQSTTLMLREPSNERFGTYDDRLGRRGLAVSGKIGDSLQETLALLVRWYSAIMHTT